jgi:hypothetical protein
MKMLPCPLCLSEEVNISKGLCACRRCKCNAPYDSWTNRTEKPFNIIGYVGWDSEGCSKFTDDKRLAGIWFDLGWKISAISERAKT